MYVYDFEITQGYNTPIEFTFEDVEPSTFQDISVSLISCVVLPGESTGKIMKRWGKQELTIDGYDVSCPLTQEETMEFIGGPCKLKAKWVREDGMIDDSKPPVFGLILQSEDKTELAITGGDA